MMEVQESPDHQTVQPKPQVSDSQTREWETKAGAWLSTRPKRRYVNTEEMDSWIESNQAFIPEDLKNLSRSQLYGRILTIHKRIRRSNPVGGAIILKENDTSQPEISQPLFQRTDQWKPVYSWLESLNRNEVLKAREIDDWLSENSDIKDQLYSRHSRNHMVHYVQRMHLRMLRRQDKLKKGSKPFTTRTPKKVHNNAVTTVSVPLPCNFSSNFVKVNEISLAKKNEAFLRYELYTELKDQLTSLLSRPKQAINSKVSGSPSLLRQKSAVATNHDGLSVTSKEEGNIMAPS